MKKLIAALLVICSLGVKAQQDLTLYNMRYLQQASFTNPSYFTECKVTIGGILFGSTYIRGGNSGFNMKTLTDVSRGIEQQSITLDKMRDINFAEFEFRRDIIHFGFRVKDKNYFSLNMSARAQARLSYSKTIGSLLLIGNGMSESEAADLGVNPAYAFLGNRASLDNSGIDMSVFTEIGLQYARKLMEDKLVIGIRPKLLLGLANVQTQNFQLGLTTDPTDFSWNIDGSYRVNTSVPFAFDSLQSVIDKPGSADIKPFQNIGFGVDLGATYNFSDKFQISGAVTDLGYIKWKSYATNYEVLDGNIKYSGLPLDASLLGNSNGDSLGSGFGGTMIDSVFSQLGPDTTYNSYKTNLTARVNLGANYQLNDKQNVGLLVNAHMVRSQLRAALTASYNIRVQKKVGFSLNYSIYNRSFANVGMGFSFNLWPIQLYILSDNVLGYVLPSYSKNYNVRMGLNWTIGCKTDKDKDGIVDKLDECPTTPGLAQFKGCPDKDGDGVEDRIDKCPEVAGDIKNNGCPDRDGDGIIDMEDECADAAGIVAFKGCPDTDEDGLKDSEDKCPTVAGIKEFAGCPDSDKDGIQDSEDACPQIAGILAFKGCPDTDKDGVQDSEDECPKTPGLKQFKGCPDTDGDGLSDGNDLCPNNPGPATYGGCPDTDGDGLPDNKDNCPEKAGPIDNKGCPFGDRDGDGIVDKDDSCPEVFGPAENKGCPYADLDKDGVFDKDDACIDTPGPKENAGCPYPDLDGDGVFDKDDQCPKTPGPADNFGCPKIDPAEQAILDNAFSSLEFETGKDVIKDKSFESLNNLADVTKKKTDWRIQISGHTDNVGNDATNMMLSEKRAKAVGKYLESRGVAREQLIIQWFGETKPIGDNTTEEGRIKNRRVEMEVIFD